MAPPTFGNWSETLYCRLFIRINLVLVCCNLLLKLHLHPSVTTWISVAATSFVWPASTQTDDKVGTSTRYHPWAVQTDKSCPGNLLKLTGGQA